MRLHMRRQRGDRMIAKIDTMRRSAGGPRLTKTSEKRGSGFRLHTRRCNTLAILPRPGYRTCRAVLATSACRRHWQTCMWAILAGRIASVGTLGTRPQTGSHRWKQSPDQRKYRVRISLRCETGIARPLQPRTLASVPDAHRP